MAYAQNPTIVRQRAAQRAADEGYVQTRSQLGPTLNFGGSVSYADHSSYDFATNSNYRSITGLSVTGNQVLFASGSLAASLDASKSAVQAGEEGLRSVEMGILTNVIGIYTAVRRDQEALQISQDNYDILKKQLDQTQAQFDAGQLTRTDVAQSQARLSASAASLASVQAQLDGDRATYVSIVGQSPVALEAEPDLPGLPTDFNAALAAAESNNPDLQSAIKTAESYKARVKVARSAFGPTIGLQGSTTENAITGNLNSKKNGLAANEQASVELRLSIPLYASGLNGSKVREAIENYNAQLQTVEITRRTVIETVSQAWSNMLAAKSAVASNEEQVKAATVAAEGVKTEQQVGLRTNIEVLNAEQELKGAQLDLVNAKRGQYVAGSQLLQVMGTLTAQAFVPDIEVYDPLKNFNKVKIVPVVQAVDGLAASALPPK